MIADEKPKTAEIRSERLKLEDLVAPIFDAAMGRRLSTARMQRFWDQAELGARLGINQHTVSRLEAGKLMVPRIPFSVTKLEEVLGPTAAKYVLMDRYSATFNVGQIQTRFWRQKFAERRPRAPGQHWTRKAIAEGRAPKGGSFMGIDSDIWAKSIELNARKNKKE